jgi:ribonuclease HII
MRAGYRLVAGVDEAGRGAWAGPVVAAAVILPKSRNALKKLAGANDSKQLTAPQRETMRVRIQSNALAWAVGCASCMEIDMLGILPATQLAMMRAVTALTLLPQALLIDAIKLPQLALPQRAFNFADSISLSVACASILAKTTRDAMMCHMHALHAQLACYSFDRHKGYGTAEHAAALDQHGSSWAHRHSFAPIRLRNRDVL